jgi:hypothetical protein
VLPKSERLRKVKAHKEILLLPAEHSTSGSQEECHRVIAMTMYCQLESRMLDAAVVITLPQVARRKSDQFCLGIVSQCGGGHCCFYLPTAGCRMNPVCETSNSQSKAGMVISAPTNTSLAAGMTWCWHIEIVSQTQMSSWMCHHPSLAVQTGRMTKDI